jgi:uncharacterized membrane protein
VDGNEIFASALIQVLRFIHGLSSSSSSPSAASSASGGDNDKKAEELRKLEDVYTSGFIDEAEYRRRKDLINNGGSSS